MKKQKICIIGGNLSGLTTAIALSRLNCEIDIVTGSVNQNVQSNRTIAISENNLDFLNRLNITKSIKKKVWPCSVMKLYTGAKNENFAEIFELNSLNNNKNKKVLYMLENSKILNLMQNKIKKIKSINIKKNKEISDISNLGLLKNVKFKNDRSSYKYNLIIVCAGSNSDLIKNFFNNEIIDNSYKETSVATIIEHNSLKNNTVRQIFLDNEILAMLPISNNKTSIVWSLKKSIKKKSNFFIKKKIKSYTENYLKNIKFLNNIEYKDLNFLIRKKYFEYRTLLFGDALHVIHPFVGQGFNMTLRDLESLEKILRKKLKLGLDIGSEDVLNEFSSEVKPRNFAFSIGVDFIKNTFSYKKLRNNSLRTINKNIFLKNIFFSIADKGFKF
ncbi:FAD-dependent monooxygenase [Pelagibacteraceae bacterium]|nr:FAD-dependent monooxygenase [Pelagibacteraceae bacterium]